MKTKHTPGPWRTTATFVQSEPYTICNPLVSTLMPYAEAQANAKLIA